MSIESLDDSDMFDENKMDIQAFTETNFISFANNDIDMIEPYSCKTNKIEDILVDFSIDECGDATEKVLLESTKEISLETDTVDVGYIDHVFDESVDLPITKDKESSMFEDEPEVNSDNKQCTGNDFVLENDLGDTDLNEAQHILLRLFSKETSMENAADENVFARITKKLEDHRCELSNKSRTAALWLQYQK